MRRVLYRPRKVVLARPTALLLALAVLVMSSAALGQNVPALIDKLKNGGDFRVRVQAALELGKSENFVVRVPLEHALDDENAAVRAAAAAALKALGDKRAVAALKEHNRDLSLAVRSQIKSSIASLEGGGGSEFSPTRLLVKLGSFKNGTTVKSGTLVSAIEQSSREKLGQLPGIQVVGALEDVNTTAKKKKLPAVMVTGRLRRLKASREGSDVIYSARIEYVVHRMPEQAILSTMAGSASAKASHLEAKDERKMAELRKTVLDAAIDSAMRRAGEALAAAMKD